MKPPAWWVVAVLSAVWPTLAGEATLELKGTDLCAAVEAVSEHFGGLEYVAVAPDNRTMDLTLPGDASSAMELIARKFGCDYWDWGGLHLVIAAAADGAVGPLVLEALRRQLPAGSTTGWPAAGASAALLVRGVARSADQARADLIERARASWVELRIGDVAPGGNARVAPWLPDQSEREALVAYLGSQLAVSALMASSAAAVPKLVHGSLVLDAEPGRGAMLSLRGGEDPTMLGRVKPDDDKRNALLAWSPSAGSLGNEATPVLDERLTLAGRRALPEWAVVLSASGRPGMMVDDQAGRTVAARVSQRPRWVVLSALGIAAGMLWGPQRDAERYALGHSPEHLAWLFERVDLAARLHILAALARGNGYGHAPLVWAMLSQAERDTLRAGGQVECSDPSPGCGAALAIWRQARHWSAIVDAVSSAAAISVLERHTRATVVVTGGEVVAAFNLGGGSIRGVQLAGSPGSADFSVMRAGGASRLALRGRAPGQFGSREHTAARRHPQGASGRD